MEQFVSLLHYSYFGSISDLEITCVSEFLNKVQPGVSIMADHGFTLKNMLHQLGAELNLLQFPADEVSRGRSIASLRIHVEHAIGCMKITKYFVVHFT